MINKDMNEQKSDKIPQETAEGYAMDKIVIKDKTDSKKEKIIVNRRG